MRGGVFFLDGKGKLGSYSSGWLIQIQANKKWRSVW